MTDHDFLTVLKYTMNQADFDLCACGGFHYMGKQNYYAFECCLCRKIFCDGLTRDQIPDSAPDSVKRAHEALSSKCKFIFCVSCPYGYCRECHENRYNSDHPVCEGCGEKLVEEE